MEPTRFPQSTQGTNKIFKVVLQVGQWSVHATSKHQAWLEVNRCNSRPTSPISITIWVTTSQCVFMSKWRQKSQFSNWSRRSRRWRKPTLIRLRSRLPQSSSRPMFEPRQSRQFLGMVISWVNWTWSTLISTVRKCSPVQAENYWKVSIWQTQSSSSSTNKRYWGLWHSLRSKRLN